MKALTLVKSGDLQITDVERPKPEKGQALVQIHAAALNKRDQFIRDGKYPGIEFNKILGSDGAGIVKEVGDDAHAEWVEREVIINPNIGWGDHEAFQARNYAILGMPSNGTFAEYVVVDVDRLEPKPAHLSFEEAAALPLGGLTAFRACFYHGKIKQDENVLISGFGGGVAQFAFQFALAAKAAVYATSGSEEKRNKALQQGATDAYDYHDPDWYKKAWKSKGGFDVVIDSAGGDQINSFIKAMRPAGRIVFYGATNGLPSSLDLYRMFWNQLTLQGSTMGSDKDFRKMVEFVTKHEIKPLVDSVRPFDEIKSAFDDMADNTKTGKLVVRL